jgi:hypothetical protein
VGVVSACANSPIALTELLEARRLAAELRLEFTKAAEAANRAVMADTDALSTAATDEARRARQTVERDVETLRAILHPLGYHDDIGELDGFWSCFAEYRRLDDEILPLAVENTNLKALRLSFGPAREAADAFRASVDAAAHKTARSNAWRARAAAAKALAAVLEIRVMHAPHIAEAEDAAMTRMEEQMDASLQDAGKALDELKAALGPAGGPQIAAAGLALDRFMVIHREIITLSRRNSDVRSLALSLGRKRVVTAECEDRLRTLGEALAKHEFTATR